MIYLFTGPWYSSWHRWQRPGESYCAAPVIHHDVAPPSNERPRGSYSGGNLQSPTWRKDPHWWPWRYIQVQRIHPSYNLKLKLISIREVTHSDFRDAITMHTRYTFLLIHYKWWRDCSNVFARLHRYIRALASMHSHVRIDTTAYKSLNVAIVSLIAVTVCSRCKVASRSKSHSNIKQKY